MNTPAKNELSILIPTYNDVCTSLVEALCRQAEPTGIRYEVIVAEDGSTRRDVIEANRAINAQPNCRYIERAENSGRAAIRNFLAQQARYHWLLFIDGDMMMAADDYLQRYLRCEATTVIDGGVVIKGDAKQYAHNLRYLYEERAAQHHTSERRQQKPYQDFHTANFLIRRDLMLAHPFDLRFRHYGYEDVLFGKTMQQNGIPLAHIDNPMSFEVFESNTHFIAKTEEGLRTLRQFSSELRGYNALLDTTQRLKRYHVVLPLVRCWHRLFGAAERRNLTGCRPFLPLFQVYRLGYFLSL